MSKTPALCAEKAILEWINLGGNTKSQWAMNCLYRAFYNRVVGWVVNRSGSPEKGHDALVDALVSFVGAIELGKNKGRFNTYTEFEKFFMRIVQNKFYDRFRGLGGSSSIAELPDDPKSPDDEAGHDPFEDLELMQDKEKLLALVEKYLHNLSSKCQDRLNRFFWLDQSDMEIAKALEDASPDVSRQMRYKCLVQMRKMFKK